MKKENKKFNRKPSCPRCLKEVRYVCPECGEPTCGNHSHGKNDSCNMVMGRRGWRELGIYDG
jgi:hypothetical protein